MEELRRWVIYRHDFADFRKRKQGSRWWWEGLIIDDDGDPDFMGPPCEYWERLLDVFTRERLRNIIPDAWCRISGDLVAFEVEKSLFMPGHRLDDYFYLWDQNGYGLQLAVVDWRTMTAKWLIGRDGPIDEVTMGYLRRTYGHALQEEGEDETQ
jgi:hypothetical protein